MRARHDTGSAPKSFRTNARHRLLANRLQSIPVAVVALLALGRWRSGRPVGYAIGDVRFPFPGSECWKNSVSSTPTGRFNPLRGGKRRCRENQGGTDHRDKLHGDLHYS